LFPPYKVFPVVGPTDVFQLKICGVLHKVDIDAAAQAGADCIGLNFFDASIRYIEPDSLEALSLCRQARKLSVMRAGVFVNQSTEEMVNIIQGLDLDVAQLHGDETLEVAQELRDLGIDVMRAVRLPTGKLTVETIEAAAKPWLEGGYHILFDAESGEYFGGNGKKLDWSGIGAWAKRHREANWTLAGGLTAASIAEAIQTSGAKSVDVASGVEEPRGTKDPKKIAAFCAAAKTAFEAAAK
jgi:phosphoribosylanthranilate isomerase